MQEASRRQIDRRRLRIARIDPVADETNRAVSHGHIDTAGMMAANVHHFDAFINDPIGQRAKLLRIWQQVATLLKDRPTSVGLEIIN
jgi:hypothetical protein